MTFPSPWLQFATSERLYTPQINNPLTRSWRCSQGYKSSWHLLQHHTQVVGMLDPILLPGHQMALIQPNGSIRQHYGEHCLRVVAKLGDCLTCHLSLISQPLFFHLDLKKYGYILYQGVTCVEQGWGHVLWRGYSTWLVLVLKLFK